MSIYLPNISVEFFDTMIHDSFLYGKGFLFRGAAQERKNIVGGVAHFRKKGHGVASRRDNLQDDVIPMNINYTDVPVTLESWNASDLSDIFGRQEVNFDETMELVDSVSNAIALRYDQQSINALEATATTPVPEASLGFIYDKFLAGRRRLVQNGVLQRGVEVYCALSPIAEEQFLKEIQVVSGDYTRNRFIDNGGLDGQEYMKVKFIVVPDMDTGEGATGGLPLSGDTRSCFMWAKPALGWAMGIDLRTTVDWIAMKRSWLVSADFKGAAKVIDDGGVVPILVDEAA
jgi:hypothetical protein